MLKELYYGKVIPWERKNPHSQAELEILRKIEEEEKYFMAKMSLDDCQRFQALSNLYSQLSMDEEGNIFSYGFALGLLTMMDIMAEAELMKE